MANWNCKVLDGEKKFTLVIKSANETTARRQLQNQNYTVIKITER